MPQDPIFIVGVPRSGTTLLSAMLSAHKNIACGPETKCFLNFGWKTERRISSDPRWPQRAVEYLLRLTINKNPVHQAFRITSQDLQSYLERRPRSSSECLAALPSIYAKACGKSRWAEKTPNHLLCVKDIRRVFPSARVIQIVRDYRDVAVSMAALPWASREPLANAYLCRQWYDASWQHCLSDPLCMTVNYEALIASPAAELADICSFIGEDYDESMTSHYQQRSTAAPGEVWKSRVAQPLDNSRVARWTRELGPHQLHAVELVCREALLSAGYRLAAAPPTFETSFLLPATQVVIEAAAPQLTDLAKAGHRCLPLGLTLKQQLLRAGLVRDLTLLPAEKATFRARNAVRCMWARHFEPFSSVKTLRCRVKDMSCWASDDTLLRRVC